MTAWISGLIGFLSGCVVGFLCLHRQNALFEKRFLFFKRLQTLENDIYAYRGKTTDKEDAVSLQNSFSALITEATVLFDASVTRDLEAAQTETADCLIYARRLFDADTNPQSPYAGKSERNKQAAAYDNALKKLSFSFFCAYRTMASYLKKRTLNFF